ncbi:hypothetical protein [Salinibacterium sp. M195]|nr:hypothetical protein [Salinibacterium sp. M195]
MTSRAGVLGNAAAATATALGVGFWPRMLAIERGRRHSVPLLAAAPA